MTFNKYRLAMSRLITTNQNGSPFKWDYLPSRCENKLCTSYHIFYEDELVHGAIDLTGQYEPIQVCQDCIYQVANGTYSDQSRFA